MCVRYVQFPNIPNAILNCPIRFLNYFPIITINDTTTNNANRLCQVQQLLSVGLWNRINNIDDKVKSHPFITVDQNLSNIM